MVFLDKRYVLDKLYRELAESLNISNSMTDEIIDSYNAVGTYLGRMEEELDIRVFPQGSLALGTIVRPIQDDVEGDYDVDLVCLLENGSKFEAKKIKNVVGNRLIESERYRKMLDIEGKRCWTLQYSNFHMDVLPSVPLQEKGISSYENKNTNIRITHKENSGEYSNRTSDPKAYREWFIKEMGEIYKQDRQILADSRKMEVEKVKLFQLRTPLQMAIQILKRHRDMMFSNRDHKPISVIITTLAAKAYNGETNLFDAIENILANMHKHIEIDDHGNAIICNPTMKSENFADKWKEEAAKKAAFNEWLITAQKDIVENPLKFVDGFGIMKKDMRNIFGSRAINDSFDAYEQKNLANRSNGLLGVTEKGNITDVKRKKVVAPLKDHTFYGN